MDSKNNDVGYKTIEQINKEVKKELNDVISVHGREEDKMSDALKSAENKTVKNVWMIRLKQTK